MSSEQEFQSLHGYRPKPETTICEYVKSRQRPSAKKFAFNLFPILTWLPQYNVKKDLFADFVTGLLIGVMKVSQGNITCTYIDTINTG